jgi:hypothetical protein
LARHGTDGVTHHDADADARPDGRTAVDDAAAYGREPFDELAWILFGEDR